MLQDCIAEINQNTDVRSTLSHGFRRGYSVFSNAAEHRNRRFVFNTDLEDFFGTINFGRVRGFFIKNRHFALQHGVATILAQIACHNNCLPQGSPCSPVISNLIAHPMDIRLAQLAQRTVCHYSRYVDDLTFSTNKYFFPDAVASQISSVPFVWEDGPGLLKVVSKAGFQINRSKTRMLLSRSRQEVTGLVVNRRINTSNEYRRQVRAMVHRLLKTGTFEWVDIAGKSVPGSLEQLAGALGYIEHIDSQHHSLTGTDRSLKNSRLATYRSFLHYKDFYAPTRLVIVCEGKTDSIYLRAALLSLAGHYPRLVTKSKASPAFHIQFFRYTDTADRVLSLGGGTGDLAKFVRFLSKGIPVNQGARTTTPRHTGCRQ